MPYPFNEEQILMRDSIREFVKDELMEAAIEADKKQEFPEAMYKRCIELGLVGIMAPEEFGGLGAGPTTQFMVEEEIGRACPTLAVTLDVNYFVIGNLLGIATPEQCAKYIPDLATGKAIGGICSTDPTGSINFAEWPMMAEKVDGGYIVNCTKLFQTTSVHSTMMIVDVMSAEGPIKLIIDSDSPGIERGPSLFEHKLGLHGSETGTMYFKDVFVPDENRLPTKPNPNELLSLLNIAAVCLGAAQECFDRTFAYLMERTKAGKKMITINGVHTEMAKLRTDLELARSIIYRGAKMYENGEDYSVIAAMAKAWVSERACYIIHRCIELHGAVGYSEDTGLTRYLRDVEGLCIAEMSTQIHWAIISAFTGVPDVIL